MTTDVVAAGGRGLRASIQPVLSARRAFLTIERNPQALRWAQTPAGILLLHLAVLALVAATGHLSAGSLAFVALTLAALAIFPSTRWMIFGIAGVLYFVVRPFRYGETKDFAQEAVFTAPAFGGMNPVLVQTAFALGFLFLLFGAIEAQRRWPKSAPARRPVVALITLLTALLGIGMLLQPGGTTYAVLWGFALFLSSSLFFIAYVFADQKAGKGAPGASGLGFARPFWGGPGVPFKGPAFLSRVEARTDEALAVTRLKALKLIVWAVILTVFGYVLQILSGNVMSLPTLLELITMHAQGVRENRGLGWAVLASEFLRTVVWMGAFSHTLVAIIRMSGFAIPRDMARPLTARSLAEFWNRYVFYFKEILVDFFFYPAFARYFKRNIALRTAFATFCAACLGNVLFSLVSQANLFGEVGVLGVVRHFESYAFYAFLLSLLLIASQLKKTKPRPEDGWLRYDVLPRVWVISVFAFLLIFADETGTLRLVERLDFAFWLLFLR